MKPDYFSAVLALVGGNLAGNVDGPLENIEFRDGQTPPTEEEVQTKLAELISDWEAQEYARNRALAFQSIGIGDQLDMQYWDKVNGTTTWQDAVAKVKSDNSK